MTDPATSEAKLAEIAKRLGNPNWSGSVEFLADPLVRRLARATGVDLSEVDDLHEAARRDIATLDRAAMVLGRLGWAVSGHLLTPDDYAGAVDVWDRDGTIDAVDAVLTPPWRNERTLDRSYGWMFRLAEEDAPDEVFDVLFERHRLLDVAKAYHMSGAYEASILLVFTQIDGLCYDWSDVGSGKRVGFFPDPRGVETFEDDRTVAGMTPVLRTVRDVVTESVWRSTVGPDLRRHGIFHGLSLGYGTEANSAKAFALLGSLIEWLRGKTDALRMARGSAE